MTDRIIVRRILTQSDEHRSLGRSQIPRFLAEIRIRSRFDSDCIMQEVKVVQIHRQYLVLRIVSFQFDGYHPLYRFLQQAFHHAVCSLGIQLLGQLLRNGRATTGTLLPEHATLDNGSSQSIEVNARMVVESDILGSHQCLYQ